MPSDRICRVACVAAMAALLAACGTTQVGLSYKAPPGVLAAADARPAALGSFTDRRGEPPNYLGAIRGGFGNPLKTIETSQPVAQIVAANFAEALRARGLLAAGAPARLQLGGQVRRLFCNQVMQREADVEIEVQLTEVGTGRVVFTRSYASVQYEGAGLASGAFGSPEELRALTERTLREVIDKALDDPGLRQALRS